MAFVDVTIPYATAGGSVSAQVGGAPQGGGIVGQGVSVGGVAPGSRGPLTDARLRNWVIAFYVIIGGTLFMAGIIFNGKGGN